MAVPRPQDNSHLEIIWLEAHVMSDHATRRAG